MKEKLLIIGSSYGIGKKLRELCSDEYDVINISRTPIDDENIESFELDALKDELPEIQDINHIVYCPGSINLKPIKSLKLDDFREDIEINLLGAVRVIKNYLKQFAKEGNKSISLYSTVAVGTGMSFHASVAASKGAIEGLTRTLAAELSPNIRVNAIAPTLTDTPLASKILRNDRAKENIIEKHPLKRILDTSDIAETTKFLLSGKAKNITGQIISVDAGMGSLKP